MHTKEDEILLSISVGDSENRKKLKTRHVSMISLGGTIGAGLFVGSSASISITGPGIIAALLLTGLLIICIMSCLGEMLLLRPGLGSFVEYIRLGNGGWAGFVTGWLYWFFWVIVIGGEAIGGAHMVKSWLPPSHLFPIWALSMFLIIFVLMINMISVHIFGECEFWLSSLKVFSIVAFVAIGGLYILHIFGPHNTGLRNLWSNGGFFPKGVAAVLSTIPSVIFMMMGSEVATVAAAESVNARQNIARITRTLGVRLTLFYVLAMGLILSIVPWTRIVPGDSPFVVAMDVIGIPSAALIMQIIVLSAILSCLNSSIYITSRLLPELSKRREAPAFLQKRSKNGVPIMAVMISCLIGLLVAYSSILSPNGVFAFLLSASGAVILFVYMLIMTAHLSVRMAATEEDLRLLPFRVWFFPWINILCLILMGGVFATMLSYSEYRMTALSSLGSAAFFYIFYYVLRFMKRSRISSFEVKSFQQTMDR